MQPTEFDGITLISENQHLAPFNIPEPHQLAFQQFSLRSLTDDVAAPTLIDVTLIDWLPNLCLCSWAALIAADCVVIPVPPEDFGTKGLLAVHQAINSAKTLNSSLKLLRLLVTRSDRRLLVHRT